MTHSSLTLNNRLTLKQNDSHQNVTQLSDTIQNDTQNYTQQNDTQQIHNNELGHTDLLLTSDLNVQQTDL